MRYLLIALLLAGCGPSALCMNEGKCTHAESVELYGFAPNPLDPDATPEQQRESALIYVTTIAPAWERERAMEQQSYLAHRAAVAQELSPQPPLVGPRQW